MVEYEGRSLLSDLLGPSLCGSPVVGILHLHGISRRLVPAHVQLSVGLLSILLQSQFCLL